MTLILGRNGLNNVITPGDLGLHIEVDETGSTFAENATLKAEAFMAASGLPTVADDSGLVVDALNGAPGIYSARYGGKNANDDDRIRLVLEGLRAVEASRRTARFVCALAHSQPGLSTQVFQGTVEGAIAPEPRGTNGFGYDPIFYYPPLGRTFGELDADSKDEVSHRTMAIRLALPALVALVEGDILEQK